MNGVDILTPLAAFDMQSMATALIVAVSSSAAWGYFKDRRKSNAEGTVAAATVAIEIDSKQVQRLQQQLGFAQAAWTEERASFERRIKSLEDELVDKDREHAAEKLVHEEKVDLLEARLKGMQRQLQDLMDELAALRTPSNGNGN